MARGDLIITQTEPFYVSLTSQGHYLIGTAGWAITEARAVRTLSVPVARRELLDVEVVQPSEGGGLLAFDWRWSMTDVGLAFRLAGVRLEDWGLRIDDGHTFKGGAQLPGGRSLGHSDYPAAERGRRLNHARGGDTIPMLECQKSQFSLPDGVHYLNCAYMSPTPVAVQAAGIDAVRRKGDPRPDRARGFFRDGERLRRLFAKLVNVPDTSRVAIVPSASYGLAIAARNTPLERGQRVVVVHEQFPSNIYTWRRACEEAGAEVRTVMPPAANDESGRAWSRRVLEAIDETTAIVALAQVHWADGTRFDLEAIGSRARKWVPRLSWTVRSRSVPCRSTSSGYGQTH